MLPYPYKKRQYVVLFNKNIGILPVNGWASDAEKTIFGLSGAEDERNKYDLKGETA